MTTIKAKALKEEKRSLGSEIVLLARHSNVAWVVVVEGATDKQVFDRMVLKTTEVVAGDAEKGGKASVVEALRIAQGASCKNVLGIIDADFENVDKTNTKKKFSLENLFMTDTHDLETMIIVATGLLALEEGITGCFGTACWKKCFLYFQCNCSAKLSHLVNELLQVAWLIGYGAYLSEKNQWRISFRDINVPSYMKGTQVDIGKIVDFFCRGYPSQIKNEMKKELEQAYEQFGKKDKWQIISGHQLSKIVSEWFQSNQNSAKLFERLLRDSFTIRDFRTTRLYQEIYDWQQKLGRGRSF
ncbi:MAG: DUF4435 domain-containing protein [Sporomusaceae bacterium]|nr:DUF4435 domain-containing protein [Sporomusaceae bacterium]